MACRFLRWIAVVIVTAYLILLIQSRNPLIVDDVHPSNSCDGSLLEKADVLYVTPKFGDVPLTEFPEWCETIRNSNKTVGLHGITHSYHEFGGNISQEELNEAIGMFEQCFGSRPELFRPPYNYISEENRQMVEEAGMTIYTERYYQHPYCHCNPHGWMEVLNDIIWC
ncbi:hypothetical protein COV20_05500 [Candidatus Woesearchaeota archaeon CG10_big_fil_rev_8_21_14_0_10_45_16]|nr:MAG: hypothetical protein COV20_05500 [Candidatus Woesearchaeota archaeon CG10_big_fil_rev_8_21_14_0_10_45_16]